MDSAINATLIVPLKEILGLQLILEKAFEISSEEEKRIIDLALYRLSISPKVIHPYDNSVVFIKEFDLNFIRTTAEKCKSILAETPAA